MPCFLSRFPYYYSQFPVIIISMTLLTKALLHTTDSYIKRLQKGGIETVEDLIGHYPRTYKDKSDVLEYFSFVNIREPNTLRVKIESITTERTRNNKELSKAILADKGRFLSEAVWFNRKFMLQKFHAGDTVKIYGKPKYEYGRLSFSSPDIEFATDEGSPIVPVYPDCNYIPSAWFEGKMACVREHIRTIPDVLPEEIRKQKGFRTKAVNLTAIHFPSSRADFERARTELAYEELFSLQYEGIMRKKSGEKLSEGRSIAIPLNPETVKDIIVRLPFPLTNGQKVVLFQILKDMERSHAMQRLLQGDVGTGKTVVVMVAAIHAILESQKLCPHPSPLPKGEGVNGEVVRKENSPKYVIDLARKGRTQQTSAEEFLWEILRDRQLDGLKFRRQHPIRRYIADFFCDEL